MTAVLTDNELLALYDRWDHVPGAPDTGIGTDMGVEDERRAMWRARAAYVEAHRALNVAILRRHEGRLARALEVREVRGWLDALAKVLGLVEEYAVSVPGRIVSSLTYYASTTNHAPKPASKGRLQWGMLAPYELRDRAPDAGFLRGTYSRVHDMWKWWAYGCGDGFADSEAEARTTILAALRADGWEVPEDEKKPAAREWRDEYSISDLVESDGFIVAKCWTCAAVWAWGVGTLRGVELTRNLAKAAAERALEGRS